MRKLMAVGGVVLVMGCGSTREQQVLDKRDSPSQPGAEIAEKDTRVTLVAGGKIKVPTALMEQLRAKESTNLQVHALKLRALDGSPTLDFTSSTPPVVSEDADKGLTQVKVSLGENIGAECTFLNGRTRLASWLAAGVGGVVSKAAALKESYPVVVTHAAGGIPAVGVQVHYLTHERLYGVFRAAVFHTGLHGVFCEMDQAAYQETFERLLATVSASAQREVGPSAPVATHEMTSEGTPSGIAYAFSGLSGTNLVTSFLEVGLLVRPEGLVGLDEVSTEEADAKGKMVKVTSTVHVNHNAIHEVVALVKDKEVALKGRFHGEALDQTLAVTGVLMPREGLVAWRKAALDKGSAEALAYQTLEFPKKGPVLMKTSAVMEDAEKRTFTVTREGASTLRVTSDASGRVFNVQPVEARGWSYRRLTGPAPR